MVLNRLEKFEFMVVQSFESAALTYEVVAILCYTEILAQ